MFCLDRIFAKWFNQMVRLINSIMSDTDLTTEQLILDAAKKVFISKGLDGTRMQEIADEAGINKSLLHYYFRSKDKLFEVIFKETVMSFCTPNLWCFEFPDLVV